MKQMTSNTTRTKKLASDNHYFNLYIIQWLFINTNIARDMIIEIGSY